MLSRSRPGISSNLIFPAATALAIVDDFFPLVVVLGVDFFLLVVDVVAAIFFWTPGLFVF